MTSRSGPQERRVSFSGVGGVGEAVAQECCAARDLSFGKWGQEGANLHLASSLKAKLCMEILYVLLSKYLSACCAPGTVLGASDTGWGSIRLFLKFCYSGRRQK